jgi:hypothetical protein
MARRYEALTVHLRQAGDAVVALSFGEIESILGARLPDSARRHPAWWSNSTQNSYSRIWRGAGFRAHVTLPEECVEFRPSDRGQLPLADLSERDNPERPARRSRWNLQEHMAALDTTFDRCLAGFEERRIFSGPSVYFYEELVKLVRGANSLLDLQSNDRLVDLTYAALTSWGMHRMGENVATKLTEFSTFSAAVRGLIGPAAALSRWRIADLNESEVGILTERLADLVERPGISASASHLVANAKTLHFLLPDLVPPIDRTYTGRFFYGLNAGRGLPGGAREAFSFMFPHLCHLARRHAPAVRSAATRRSYMCLGQAKVLDNAIVGYMLTRFPDPAIPQAKRSRL